MIKRFSWQEIHSWLLSISDEIKESNIDYIYGIPRGGLVPAVILSHQTNIPLLMKFPIHEQFLHEFAYKKILFVDDIVHSGETFYKYNAWIDPLEGYNNRFISLVKNESFDHEDIWKFGFAVTKEDWVLFPWEKELKEDEAEKLIKKHIGEQSND